MSERRDVSVTAIPGCVAEKIREYAAGFEVTDHYPDGRTVLKVGPLKRRLYRVGKRGTTFSTGKTADGDEPFLSAEHAMSFGPGAPILGDIEAAIRVTAALVADVVHAGLGWMADGEVGIVHEGIFAGGRKSTDVVPAGWITFVRRPRSA